ncbi:ABC transporter substrate-binding protein [Kitasatospora cineracea]|uniref:Carbohydrate ABC transporter substrate-binding protein (CUT1 family) n=1 Tax=Kitasatospora cineracea TaxID=88074 RepID=A0A3N4RZR5_9ACTN|nr:extracellular solute-binding protein [Kitasatospora cineracea]RPE36175.1 carbohydrate ABC transporter substrate-binding protein (CUT1 family) [Kitasatospora cineracea]
MPTPTSGTRLATTAAAALLALGSAACDAAEPHVRPAGVAPAGPSDYTTLTIATSEDSGMTKLLAAAFHTHHLGIVVEVRTDPRETHDHDLPGLLVSDAAPDLVLLNSLGIAPPGSIRSLDDYARQHGWEHTYPSGLLDQWRTSGDGRQLGGGHLWAAPAGFSLVGAYYNKDLANRLNITPAAGRKEFDTACTKAKAAGVLPIQLGNQQGHASLLFQSLTDTVEGAAKATDWVNGRTGTTLQQGGPEAATALSEWAARGCFPADPNNRTLSSAVTAFGAGAGLYFVDGSWDAQPIDQALHGRVGFVPFVGENGRATGIGTSVAYAIPTRARHPDAAAAFLDYLNSPEAAQIEFNAGFLPVAHADQVTTDPGGVMNDIADAWIRVNDDNGLVNFFNNSTGTMNDTLTAQSQRLLARQTTPAAFLAAVQEDWQHAH